VSSQALLQRRVRRTGNEQVIHKRLNIANRDVGTLGIGSTGLVDVALDNTRYVPGTCTLNELGRDQRLNVTDGHLLCIESSDADTVDSRSDMALDGRTPRGFDNAPDSVETMVIKTAFVGANLNPSASGGNLMDYKCNYFLGNDPAKWRKEQVAVASQTERLTGTGRDYVDQAIEILELSKLAYSLYVTRSGAEKRQLLKSVLSNCLFDGVTLYPTYKKPFDLIAEGVQNQFKLPGLNALRTIRVTMPDTIMKFK